MVNLFSSFNKKHSRPLKFKKEPDKGTPELQAKREITLLSCSKAPSLSEKKDLHLKIKGGCLLHRLFLEEKLTETQLKIGLALRKLYHKAFRSMGIQMHLKSINGRLNNLKGRSLESFECPLIERRWKTIANFLSHLMHSQKIPGSIVDIILYDKGADLFSSGQFKKVSIKMIQTTLDEAEKMINKWR